MKQSEEAKADVITIGKYVLGREGRKVGYAHYTVVVSCDTPEGWDSNRVGRALIDYVDNGWSPFGGSAIELLNGRWVVKVYTD
jgi:hypothetical protein